MRVSSVQINSNSPSFNGLVFVRNLKTRTTRVYKVSPESDRVLADTYNKIRKSVSVDASIVNIKQYISDIFNATKDEFINNLPAVVKKDSQEFALSAESTFATYQGGATFSELKTNGFEITHDMAK